MTTQHANGGLESHAEAIRDKHRCMPDRICFVCRKGYPCPDYVQAGAILVAVREAAELIEAMFSQTSFAAIHERAEAALVVLRGAPQTNTGDARRSGCECGHSLDTHSDIGLEHCRAPGCDCQAFAAVNDDA